MNDDSNLNSLGCQSLLQKYRPRTLADFVGITKPRQILTEFSNRPFDSTWLFWGPPGMGKSTVGMVLADEIEAQLHHVRGKSCNLETVEEVCANLCYSPRSKDDWTALRFHLALVDEANDMSYASQVAFLSRLDETAPPPNTIFIFTANKLDNLEERFLSRCRVLEFSSDGIQGELECLLRRIWAIEAPNNSRLPDFAKIVRDSRGNVRSSLNALELQLLSVSSVESTSTRTLQLVGTVNGITARGANADTLSDDIHRLAKVVPEMPPKQYAALKSDIKQRGVLVPVLRYQGQILDGGRGRWRACKELGIDCPVREYEGSNPLAEVLSLNAIRRHLNASQRAMIGARIANLKHGGNRRRKHQDANLQLDLHLDVLTIEKTAMLLNVSPRSIETAKEVLSEADPELVARVDAGEVTVSKAARILRKSFIPRSAGFSSPTPRDLNEHAQWIRREITRIYQSGVLDCAPTGLLLAMTTNQQADVLRIVPAIISWLGRFATPRQPKSEIDQA